MLTIYGHSIKNIELSLFISDLHAKLKSARSSDRQYRRYHVKLGMWSVSFDLCLIITG